MGYGIMIHTATLLTLRVPAFEAAIRKAVDLRLASRPVIVVTAFKPLGRVLAACPAAQAHGVVEDMHFPAARICCPDAAFHLPDRRLAEDAMRGILKEAGKYSPLVEPAGGGRVVLDIKGTERLWGDNFAVADSLRHAVQATCRLPAAAGLAVRRPWSLLASRAAGEDGVCHIPPGEEDDFLNQVPVAWVDGLTPQTRTLLTEMNIRSLGQIRHCGRLELGRQFGRSSGDTLWNVLHPSEWDSVSFLADDALLDMAANRIRIEAALAEASVEREKMRLVVRDLAARAATALRSKRLGAARLRLTLLHADGALKTAGGRTGGFIQHEAALQRVAEGLLARVFVRRVQVIRLWLDAEKLATPERQGTLFQANASAEPDSGDRDSRKLLRAVDRIKKRYGESAMQPAALLQSAARQKQLALASRDTA